MDASRSVRVVKAVRAGLLGARPVLVGGRGNEENPAVCPREDGE